MTIGKNSKINAYQAIKSGDSETLVQIFADLPPADPQKGDPKYHLANGTFNWDANSRTENLDQFDHACLNLSPSGKVNLLRTAIIAANKPAFDLLLKNGAEIPKGCIAHVVQHIPLGDYNAKNIKKAEALTHILSVLLQHPPHEDLTEPLCRVVHDEFLLGILMDYADKHKAPVDYTRLLISALSTGPYDQVLHPELYRGVAERPDSETMMRILDKILTKNPTLNSTAKRQSFGICYDGDPHARVKWTAFECADIPTMQKLRDAGMQLTEEDGYKAFHKKRPDLLGMMLDEKIILGEKKVTAAQRMLDWIIEAGDGHSIKGPPRRDMVECCLSRGAQITRENIKNAAWYSLKHIDVETSATLDYIMDKYDAQLLGKSSTALARIGGAASAVEGRAAGAISR